MKKILLITFLSCFACGVDKQSPADSVDATQSPSFTGSAHFRGDAYCNGPVHVVEIVSQSFTRPIAGITSYYTTSLALSWQDAIDASVDYVSFNCSPSFKIPSAPICGDLGALCSTGDATCAVYRRRAGQSAWGYLGSARMWSLTYQPLNGYGAYTTALDGAGISALGCASIWFTLGT